MWTGDFFISKLKDERPAVQSQPDALAEVFAEAFLADVDMLKKRANTIAVIKKRPEYYTSLQYERESRPLTPDPYNADISKRTFEGFVMTWRKRLKAMGTEAPNLKAFTEDGDTSTPSTRWSSGAFIKKQARVMAEYAWS